MSTDFCLRTQMCACDIHYGKQTHSSQAMSYKARQPAQSWTDLLVTLALVREAG